MAQRSARRETRPRVEADAGYRKRIAQNTASVLLLQHSKAPEGHTLGGFVRDKRLNQYSIAMVDLVLDDLCRPAGKGLDAGFAVHGLVLHLDALVALCFPHALQ